MRVRWLVFIVVTVLALSGCKKKEKQVVLDSKEKKISYVMGMLQAQNAKNSSMNIDMESCIAGFRDHLTGAPEKLTTDEVNQMLGIFTQERRAKIALKNLQEAEAFLLENGKKPGVVTTASGLQYKVITAGKGPKPKATDTVRVHYRGYFPNNQEFDSSYSRNEPAVFPLGRVIKGWTEALQLMPIGSKWQLFIPSRLAYGEEGRGNVIPPNQMLLFDVELLEIVPPAKTNK